MLVLFTDILAGFTFNNRVLRLPAIVLLNTTMDLFRKLGRIPEEGPSFRVETSCSIKQLLEDEELCCWVLVLVAIKQSHAVWAIFLDGYKLNV